MVQLNSLHQRIEVSIALSLVEYSESYLPNDPASYMDIDAVYLIYHRY